MFLLIISLLTTLFGLILWKDSSRPNELSPRESGYSHTWVIVTDLAAAPGDRSSKITSLPSQYTHGLLKQPTTEMPNKNTFCFTLSPAYGCKTCQVTNNHKTLWTFSIHLTMCILTELVMVTCLVGLGVNHDWPYTTIPHYLLKSLQQKLKSQFGIPSTTLMNVYIVCYVHC